jgi:rhodanese-related sulfurtransferase
MVDGATDGTQRITPQALQAALRRGERVVVLDVRRREAWATDPTHIPGATWVPLDDVPRRTRDLPADTHLVVYCS